MKKIGIGFTSLVISIFALLSFTSPAQAAGTLLGPIATTGDYDLVAVSPDGSLVASSSEYNAVTIYNVETGASRNIDTPSSDAGFPAFSPDNSLLYVASYNPSEIYVYDLSDDHLDRVIDMPTEMWNLVVSPDGNSLYSLSYGGSLYKIELDNADAIVGPLNLSSDYTWQICLSADGSTLYNPDYYNEEVDVVQTSSLSQIDTWPTGDGSDPYACSLDNSGNVYIGNYGSDNVLKFSPEGSLLSTAAEGISYIYGIAASCDTLYVGNYYNNFIPVFSLSDLTAETAISVTGNPGGAGWFAYSGSRSDDGSVVAFGGYNGSDGLVIIQSPECSAQPQPQPQPLPNTGSSAPDAAPTALLAGILILAGLLSMSLIRRSQ